MNCVISLYHVSITNYIWLNKNIELPHRSIFLRSHSHSDRFLRSIALLSSVTSTGMVCILLSFSETCSRAIFTFIHEDLIQILLLLFLSSLICVSGESKFLMKKKTLWLSSNCQCRFVLRRSDIAYSRWELLPSFHLNKSQRPLQWLQL